MSTLLSRLQAAALSGIDYETQADEAEMAARKAAEAAFEAQAQAQFLHCQDLAVQKLQDNPRIVAGNYRVVVMSERCGCSKPIAPLTDCIEAKFRAEGVQTDRCYGGNELHMDCELILVIPVPSQLLD